jgi:two-component system response regulator NreC
MIRPTTPNLRILLADDHDVMRQGTQALIERHTGWQVCGVAATGREAVQCAEELKPDIVVMDMTMPELNGLDAAVLIKRRQPGTEVVMFTAHEDEDLVREAFNSGLKSVIFKSEAYECLVQAIQSLSEHKPFFSERVSNILFSRLAAGGSTGEEPEEHLTPREREIVQLVAEGRSNKEIADSLGISLRTAETHRASVLRKLKLDSVAGLVRYAIRHKLIEPSVGGRWSEVGSRRLFSNPVVV